MNAAQRQLLLFESLMTVLLAPYFNPWLHLISQRFHDFIERLENPGEVRVRLFCPRSSLKKPFIIVVYVKAPYREQQATLNLPQGLVLAAGEQFRKRVPPPTEHGYSQVSWKVVARNSGEYEVQADVPGLGLATECVRVRDGGLFD